MMDRLLKIIALAFVFSLVIASFGQTTPDPRPAAPVSAAALPSAVLRSALSDVQGVTAGLNVAKWKAPGRVRQATQEDVDSIQRDLGTTLPGLLSQADSAPESIPPTFAVYRNLDALYDVLLRVSQTADLAAPSGEASSVASSLQRLEAARTELGNAIVQSSQRNEAQIIALQAAVRTARTSPVARKRETIIDDGPVKARPRTRRKRTTHRKPSPTPATKPASAPASH